MVILTTVGGTTKRNMTKKMMTKNEVENDLKDDCTVRELGFVPNKET